MVEHPAPECPVVDWGWLASRRTTPGPAGAIPGPSDEFGKSLSSVEGDELVGQSPDLEIREAERAKLAPRLVGQDAGALHLGGVRLRMAGIGALAMLLGLERPCVLPSRVHGRSFPFDPSVHSRCPVAGRRGPPP